MVHHYGEYDGDCRGKRGRAVDPYHVSHCARSSCFAGLGFLLSASVRSCVIIFSLRTCIFSHHLVCWINCKLLCISASDSNGTSYNSFVFIVVISRDLQFNV